MTKIDFAAGATIALLLVAIAAGFVWTWSTKPVAVYRDGVCMHEVSFDRFGNPQPPVDCGTYGELVVVVIAYEHFYD